MNRNHNIYVVTNKMKTNIMNINGEKVLYEKLNKYVIYNSRKNTYDVIKPYQTSGIMIMKCYNCISRFDTEEEVIDFIKNKDSMIDNDIEEIY